MTIQIKEVLFRTSLLGSIFNSCISLTYGMDKEQAPETTKTNIHIRKSGLDERLRQQAAKTVAEKESVEQRDSYPTRQEIEQSFEETIKRWTIAAEQGH